MDVYNWIVYGTPPRLHRAILRWGDAREELPDGTWLVHRSVTLTLNAPVTQDEMVGIYREHIRELWEPATFGAAPDPSVVGPAVSDMDYHLLQLVQRTPGATWAERLPEWKATPRPGCSPVEWGREQGQVTAEALRVRWHRIPEDVKDKYTTTED
jgi:hypothetical protein